MLNTSGTKNNVATVAIVNPSGIQVKINSTNANPKTVTFDANNTTYAEIDLTGAVEGAPIALDSHNLPGMANQSGYQHRHISDAGAKV